MSSEAPQESRPIQPDESDHTRSKENVLARGVNVEVDRLNERKRPGDYGTNTGYANSLLAHPTRSLRETGREDIYRELKERYDRDPGSVGKRQRIMFKFGDWLEKKGALDLIEDLLAPRPSPDDKRSYWGTGPYRHMSIEERRAYRRSRGYE